MPEWLTAVGSALLGGGLWGGIAAWRKQIKGEPIEASAAAIAAAREASGMALAVAQRLDGEVKDLRADADRREARAQYQDGYIADLHLRWPEHRTRDAPPPYRPPASGGLASGS